MRGQALITVYLFQVFLDCSCLLFLPKVLYNQFQETNIWCFFPGVGGPHPVAFGILVSWPGMEPMPPALEMQSLNHWTAREVPPMIFFYGDHIKCIYSWPLNNARVGIAEPLHSWKLVYKFWLPPDLTTIAYCWLGILSVTLNSQHMFYILYSVFL